MLPDTDHPQGTIAWALPPVTKWVAHGVEAISGGHRHATHSLLGVAAFGLLAFLASFFIIEVDGREVALGGGLVAVLLVAFAAKSLRLAKNVGRSVGGVGKDLLSSVIGPWLLALGTAGAVTWFLDYRWDWLPVAVVVGAFLHNFGDSLTTEGVPWLWPLNPKPPKVLRGLPGMKVVWQNNGYFRIPLLGSTDSLREKMLGFLMTAYILYLAAFEIMGMTGVNMLQ